MGFVLSDAAISVVFELEYPLARQWLYARRWIHELPGLVLDQRVVFILQGLEPLLPVCVCLGFGQVLGLIGFNSVEGGGEKS